MSRGSGSGNAATSILCLGGYYGASKMVNSLAYINDGEAQQLALDTAVQFSTTSTWCRIWLTLWIRGSDNGK